MKEYQFYIAGISGAEHSAAIEKQIKAVPGVELVTVSFLSNQMMVCCSDGNDYNRVREEVVRESEKIGCRVWQKQNESERKALDNAYRYTEYQIKKRKRSVAFSFVLLVALLFAAWWQQRNADNLTYVWAGTLTKIIVTFAVLYLNRDFYLIGWKMLQCRLPNMDTLLMLSSGIGVSFGVGISYQIGAVYGKQALIENYCENRFFEAAVFILALGAAERLFEAYGKEKALLFALDAFPEETNRTVILQDETEIDINNLKVGDIVIVKLGMQIPADGEVLEGSAQLEESALYGMEKITSKGIGSMAYAQTRNQSGTLKLKVMHTGEDTVFEKKMHKIYQEAVDSADRKKYQTKASAVFTVLLAVGSAMVLFIWMLIGKSIFEALIPSMAVLAIGCVSAYTLSRDLHIWYEAYQNQKKGVIGCDITAAADINTVLWDGLEILTKENPRITDIFTAAGVSEKELLCIAASLEKQQMHPSASIMVEYAEKQKIPLVSIEESVLYQKTGVAAKIGNHRYCTGNLKMMNERGIDLSEAGNRAEELKKQGKSIIYIAGESRLLGFVAIMDEIKEGCAEDMEKLKRSAGKTHPIQTILLTEEDAVTAQKLAETAGVDRVISEVIPEDMPQVMMQLQEEGCRIAAVSLSACEKEVVEKAGLTVSLCNVKDLEKINGDIVCLGKELQCIADLLKTAREFRKKRGKAAGWIAVYLLCGVFMAAGSFYALFGNWLYPAFGATAALLVNSLLLKWTEKPYQIAKVPHLEEIEEAAAEV